MASHQNSDFQDGPPTDAQVAQFDMVQPLLAAAHKEMAELSKKKQDGPVNDLKIRHINRLLEAAEQSLNGDASTAFLERLDEEAIPQNSDAVLVLSQWLAAMEQFKTRHHGWDGSTSRWFTQESPGSNPRKRYRD